MPSSSSSTSPDHAALAEKLVRSLAEEGHPQGELGMRALANGTRLGDFYIEDVYTRVPADHVLIRNRLIAAGTETDGNVRVVESAAYSWVDDEFRARFEHVLMLDTLHTLVVVSGVLSYDDVKSASRTPLWGSVAFYRTARQRDRAYARHCQTLGTGLIKKAADSILAIHRRMANPPAVLPPLPTPRAAARHATSPNRNRTR